MLHNNVKITEDMQQRLHTLGLLISEMLQLTYKNDEEQYELTVPKTHLQCKQKQL